MTLEYIRAAGNGTHIAVLAGAGGRVEVPLTGEELAHYVLFRRRVTAATGEDFRYWPAEGRNGGLAWWRFIERHCHRPEGRLVLVPRDEQPNTEH